METKRQKHKITNLKIIILLEVVISIILIIFISSVSYYNFYLKKEDDKQAQHLNQYISNLQKNTKDFQSQIADIKQYTGSWEKADAKTKHFDGINITEVNTNFDSLSEKYSLASPTIKVTLPTILKEGIFDREFSNVMLSNISITFDSLDDIKAMLFIKEFVDNLPGYKVITTLNLSKKGNYTDEDLIQISSGEIKAFINTKLEFSWYVFEIKTRN